MNPNNSQWKFANFTNSTPALVIEFDIVNDGFSRTLPNNSNVINTTSVLSQLIQIACGRYAESGRKVEEVIYEFARNLPGESCLHSFIINDADADTKSLFSDVEWKEITSSEVKENPKLELSSRINE
ncbi:hypothetical protein RhiirA4_450966 [Rhizophagus irregularis]|uniref:Uncharacterized protein n=1 Tax=Rhizophagus irregularis TaxID=588596 RepID=A0A2I1FUG7_9GLOM|nr:hypothetical protein RhiirA4_450966 [Rhizophagus irregularis]